MNAERLLQHYEQIADAPDAIARLRRFILDLAVRGKLVPQDPADEPASELLERIQFEKARLEKRSAGKGRALIEMPPKSMAFTLPDSWRWLPATYPALIIPEGDRKVQTKDVLGSGLYPVVDQGKVFIRGYCNDHAKVIHPESPIILFGDHTRQTKLIDFSFVVGADGVKLLQPIGLAFTYYFLVIDWLPLESRGYGRHFKLLKESWIPLPPLAEQHRIVAKVDELMGLCDALEAARTEREAKRNRLAAASLARLNTPDPETFYDDARFALDALSALTARPDQIKQLRQTILNLAVRGKLVPQDPTDEPAETLLKRISEERADRVRIGAIPKLKATNRDVARLSSGLPVGWSPIALGDVCDLVTSGSRGWGEYYAESGPRFVRAQNVRFGRMRLDDLACVQPPSNSEGARTQLYRNDLLIVITGAGVTNPALLEVDLGEAYVSQHVGLVRSSYAGLSQWLLLCLMADAGGRGELLECAYGAGKPGLNLDNIRSLSVPLPPLTEQHRIVTKVDELMALCDLLETSLTSANETRKRLLDTLLTEALAPLDVGALKEAAE